MTAFLGALGVADVFIGDVRVPGWVPWAAAFATLQIAQFRAFHDVRRERDSLTRVVKKKVEGIPPQVVTRPKREAPMTDALSEKLAGWYEVVADDRKRGLLCRVHPDHLEALLAVVEATQEATNCAQPDSRLMDALARFAGEHDG